MMGAATPTEASQRALAYAFLADGYDAPFSPGRLAALAADAQRLAGDQAGLAAPLCTALAEETDWEAQAQRLAIEHARLFLGLREGHSLAPPYASLWREGRLMGARTQEVAALYVAVGFTPVGRPGPCDHLPTQLRFMASLCDAEHRALHEPATAADLRTRQAYFINTHLLGWLPDYCAALAADTREPFYSALIEVTLQALTADAAYLATGTAHGAPLAVTPTQEIAL